MAVAAPIAPYFVLNGRSPILRNDQSEVIAWNGFYRPKPRYAGDSTWITRLASMSFTFAP